MQVGRNADRYSMYLGMIIGNTTFRFKLYINKFYKQKQRFGANVIAPWFRLCLPSCNPGLMVIGGNSRLGD